MRLSIVAVGRAKSGPAAALYEEYARRLSWRLTLREVTEHRRLPPAQLRAREAGLLLAAVPKGALIVALDAAGETLSSQEFARRLEGWRENGGGELAFVIGGADGLDGALKARAELVLSLGPMTWPHLLVRGLLAEQLYRAQTLISGHPYHRE